MEKNKKENLILVGVIILFVSTMLLQSIIKARIIAQIAPTGENPVPAITAANSIISQFQVLISSFMVAGLGKKGYVGAVCLNAALSLSSFLGAVVTDKGIPIISAIIPLVTLIAVTIIYIFSLRVLKAKDELERSNKELIDANKAMREKDEKLTYLAYYDVLTGLANRQLFIEKIDESIQENSKTPFTVIYFDIDNFKHINDSYGHNTGDIMLSTYADRLRLFCGDSDFVGKLGGDEFAVILKGNVTENGVVSYIERLRNAVCKPVQVEGVTLQASMSFGVASYPNNGANSQEILRNTDIAVYNAKANGKDRTCFYSQQQLTK